MKIKAIFIGLLCLLICSCAQVPKESLELSTTVGRDIAVAHEAHVQLAALHFARMKEDVNRFVDNVYTPYLIRSAMERQMELAISDVDSLKRRSLLLAINAAFHPEASDELQQKVLIGMEILVREVHSDIEKMRLDLHSPLNRQEESVIGSINRAYQQIHYANSIVTGHLSSVVKVHDAQQELLDDLGIERDLREEIGEGISKVSKEISSLVNEAELVSDKIDRAEDNAQKLKDVINELNTF